MASPQDDHDPAAFAAEVARRVRAAVVSEVPPRRGLWILTGMVILGMLVAGTVLLLTR